MFLTFSARVRHWSLLFTKHINCNWHLMTSYWRRWRQKTSSVMDTNLSRYSPYLLWDDVHVSAWRNIIIMAELGSKRTITYVYL